MIAKGLVDIIAKAAKSIEEQNKLPRMNRGEFDDVGYSWEQRAFRRDRRDLELQVSEHFRKSLVNKGSRSSVAAVRVLRRQTLVARLNVKPDHMRKKPVSGNAGKKQWQCRSGKGYIRGMSARASKAAAY